MRYPGGKGRCYKRIVSLMAPHDAYIETHLGGGAAMRGKRPSSRDIGVEIDPAVVARWRALEGTHCEIVQSDALEFLAEYPFRGNELVYADPPYPRETRRKPWIYRYDYDTDDHVRLLALLKRLPCAVMVSSYPNALYERALADWRSVEIPGDSHAGPRVEVVWMNYAEPSSLHDPSHLGDGFRERERIRRRREGLLRRIGGLHPHERHALLEGLAAAHRDDVVRALGNVP